MPSKVRRAPITSLLRLGVYDKTGGLCYYCGVKLNISKMQIDHVEPLEHGGVDNLTNLVPACSDCNYYKKDSTLDEFRQKIHVVVEDKLKSMLLVRVAINYNMLTESVWDGKFHFEKIAEEKLKNG